MNEEILCSIKKEQEITNSLLEIIANRIERNHKSVIYSSDNSKDDLLKKSKNYPKKTCFCGVEQNKLKRHRSWPITNLLD